MSGDSDIRITAPEGTLNIVLSNDLVERICRRTAQIVVEQMPEHLDQQPRWLDLRAAAEYCARPYGTMQRLASARQIPGAVKQGKRWICDRHALDDWLQTGAVPNRSPRGS